MWIDVKDKMPTHNAHIFVRLVNMYRNRDEIEYAVATFDKNYGFDSDSYGYRLDMDDDSGLVVYLDGAVTHWMEIPKI